ncbi:hypothetical protein [Catenovulum agarivorans]|uniref:hypothetical protein n=1 Tax=Catenovulum agarivorans TaxID=1172192 RepID=UPI0002FEE465|nr:hypothetical protein [Catenovulum agarivorans]
MNLAKLTAVGLLFACSQTQAHFASETQIVAEIPLLPKQQIKTAQTGCQKVQLAVYKQASNIPQGLKAFISDDLLSIGIEIKQHGSLFAVYSKSSTEPKLIKQLAEKLLKQGLDVLVVNC